MAPTSQSIVRFSSQDPVHCAENVLPGRKGKWLSQKTDRNGQIELEIHLSQAIKIAYINIGNAGSAFVEILVGRSMWPQHQKYVSFLPTTTLMSPQDSKTGRNTETVKMLDKASFCKDAYDEQWDRIRVICCQPFNKTKQFGLHFIDLTPGFKLTFDNDHKSTPSPAQELAQLKSILSPKSIKPGITSRSPSSITTQSRAAGLVQAALKDKRKSVNNMKPMTPVRKRHNTDLKMRTSPYPANGNAQTQREKTRSRGCAEDIQDEVECFLEGCKLNEMPLEMLEQITYRNLKERMEQQRGCPLSKLERKIFLQLAQKSVDAVMTKHDVHQERPSSDCDVIDSPWVYQQRPPLDDDCVMTVPSSKELSSPEVIDIDSDFLLGIGEASTSDDQSTVQIPNPVFSGIIDVSDDTAELGFSEEVLCPICYKTFPVEQIDVHADLCAQSSFG